MTGVVHSSLYQSIKGEPTTRLLVFKSLVDVVRQTFCHPVFVLGQVWVPGNLAVTAEN